MLNINFWNIAFTVINLLVLYLFLKHFLMKPLMEIMEKRQAQVENRFKMMPQVKSRRPSG